MTPEPTSTGLGEGATSIHWSGEDERHGFSNSPSDDYSFAELGRLAARSKDANQSRRLLSLAAVMDGMARRHGQTIRSQSSADPRADLPRPKESADQPRGDPQRSGPPGLVVSVRTAGTCYVTTCRPAARAELRFIGTGHEIRIWRPRDFALRSGKTRTTPLLRLRKHLGNPGYEKVIVPLIFLLFTVVMFVFVRTILQLSLATGVCCADDGAIASAAKNLAMGHGYSTSLQSNGMPGLFTFDYGITTGPPIVIPIALAVRAVGNQLWIPGLTNALIICFLLAIIFQLHVRCAGWIVACMYMLIFISLTFAMTTFHTEHWHSALGEFPSALMVIVGITLLAQRNSWISTAWAGLLFGLAFLTKFIAVFGIAPAFLWLLATVVFGRQRKEGMARFFLAGLFALIPILSFETWKFFSIGAEAYVSLLMGQYAFIQSLGVRQTSFSASIEGFSQRFGVELWAFFFSEVLAVFAILRSKSVIARSLALMLLGSSILHFFYWAAFSVGWPRYLLQGLFYHCAGLAVISYIIAQKWVGPTLAIVFIVAHSGRAQAVADTVGASLTRGFGPSPHQTALSETSRFLRDAKLPILSGVWFTSIDLEYALPAVGNFLRYDKAQPGESYLAVNTTFTNAPFVDPGLEAFWAQFCTEVVFQAERYRVVKCNVP